MGNICGVKNKKIEPSDYNEIVDQVDEICGHTIPGDLIVEILCMLPVKSLARFKIVCKPWKLLINSQAFINKHLHATNPRYGTFSLREPKKGDSTCPLGIHDIVGSNVIFGGYSSRGTKIGDSIYPAKIDYTLGTCNGIICLKVRSDEKPLILFNPSTREYSYVPPQLYLRAKGYNVGTEYGFCYLPKTKEYLIVFFYQLYNQDSKLKDITTLTLGKIPSSREAKNISLPGRPRHWREAKVTSGTTMFWLGCEHDSDDQIVIFYDVVEEKFGTMKAPPSPSPPPPPSDAVRRSLGLLKGSVIMFDSFIYNSTFFDIWMLIDDDVSNGRSWMKYRRVGPFARGRYSLEVCWDNRWKVYCTDQSDEAYENNSRNWFFCDIETDKVEKIQKDQAKYDIVNYQESLVSITTLLPYIDHENPKDIH